MFCFSIFQVFLFFFCFVCFSVKLRWKRSENFTSVKRLFVFVERGTSLHMLCLLKLRNININNNNNINGWMKMREIRYGTTRANDVLFLASDLEFVSTVTAGGGVGLDHLRMTSGIGWLSEKLINLMIDLLLVWYINWLNYWISEWVTVWLMNYLSGCLFCWLLYLPISYDWFTIQIIGLLID